MQPQRGSSERRDLWTEISVRHHVFLDKSQWPEHGSRRPSRPPYYEHSPRQVRSLVIGLGDGHSDPDCCGF
jgi:hypothetical protein